MDPIIVLDTDVLIDYFRGFPEAKHYISAIPVSQRAITDVTKMELFKGARNRRDLLNIERFIAANFTHIFPVSAAASRLAVDLVKQYSLAQGLTLPDALIAAITLLIEGKLITGNQKDFEYIQGLDVETPGYRIAAD